MDVLLHLSAEVSRRLEEREVLVMQLQRTKSGLTQTMEEMKKQLEEECKVSLILDTLDELCHNHYGSQSITISNHN